MIDHWQTYLLLGVTGAVILLILAVGALCLAYRYDEEEK